MSKPSNEGTDAEFPKDDQEARLDIDLTRQELGETVQELAHKLDVPARAREQADHLGTVIKEKLPPPVAEKAGEVAGTVRRNPLPAAGAVLVFLIVVRAISRRRKS